MTTKTRNIIIGIVVALVIAGGGVGVYFIAQRAGTGVSTFLDGSFKGSNITWLNCEPITTAKENYNQAMGQGFTETYKCTNNSSQNHTLEWRIYDLEVPAFWNPPYGGQKTTCYENAQRKTGEVWPPEYDHDTILPVIANRENTTETDCDYLTTTYPSGSDIWSLQEPWSIEKPPEYTTNFAANETKTIEISHATPFDTCSYYQVDDLLKDEAGTYELIMGDVHRSYATVGQEGCREIQPPTEAVGNFEIRVWEEVDHKNNPNEFEYSTPTAGGTDNPIPGIDFTIQKKNNQGQFEDVTESLGCGSTTGGAGRIQCHQIPIGEYKVTMGAEPDETQYTGPYPDPHDNPYPGEKHNATGTTELILHVVAGAQPTGSGEDVITFFDYPYLFGEEPQATGKLIVRTWVEAQGGDKTYTPQEGVLLANTPYVVSGTRPQDTFECDIFRNQKNWTNQYGLGVCEVPAGTYQVNIDPDVTAYSGPQDTANNPNGDDPLQDLEVVAGGRTYADFMYTYGVSEGVVCNTLTATKVNQNTYSFVADVDPKNTQYTYEWQPDMSDPNTKETDTHTGNFTDEYTYTGTGTFSALFKTVTNTGQVISSCQTQVIIYQPNAEVSCSLAATPVANDPNTYKFVTTLDPDTYPATSTVWNFGDGEMDTQQKDKNPKYLENAHTYGSEQDTYTAQVAVRKDNDVVAVCEATIALSEEPGDYNCELVATPNSGPAPLNVNFELSPVGEPEDNFTSSEWWYEYDPAQIDPDTTLETPADIWSSSHTYQVGQYTAHVKLNHQDGGYAECDAAVQADDEGPTALNCTLSATTLHSEPGLLDVRYNLNSTTPREEFESAEWWYDYTASSGNADETDTNQSTMWQKDWTYQNPPKADYTAHVKLNHQSGQSTECETSVVVQEPYNPNSEYTCTLEKTTTDETPDNEETPDDLKTTHSSPGEEIDYTISWECADLPADTSGLSMQITDTIPQLMSVVVDPNDPTSVPPDNGTYNESQGIITWTISGASLAQGSVHWTGIVDADLAPGNYVLTNTVVGVFDYGEIWDFTHHFITVTDENPDEPDIRVVKWAVDKNGGLLMPGDVIEYYIWVWNNGNQPLNDVRVTGNVEPNVHSFTVTEIPDGACDNFTASGGSNGTGFLDVDCFNLPNRGDYEVINFEVTVNSGVPEGTELYDLVTAATDDDQDTDDERVYVSRIVPRSRPPITTGSYSDIDNDGEIDVPPYFGGRAVDLPEKGEAPETGISATTWAILLSIIMAVVFSGYILVRQRFVKT